MEPHVALERPGPSVILDLPDLSEPQGFGVVPGLVWAFLIRDDGSAEPLDPWAERCGEDEGQENEGEDKLQLPER